jgi:hypothetical protein
MLGNGQFFLSDYHASSVNIFIAGMARSYKIPVYRAFVGAGHARD